MTFPWEAWTLVAVVWGGWQESARLVVLRHHLLAVGCSVRVGTREHGDRAAPFSGYGENRNMLQSHSDVRI